MLSSDLPFRGGIGRDVFGGLEMTGVFDSVVVSMPLHAAITATQQNNAAKKKTRLTVQANLPRLKAVGKRRRWISHELVFMLNLATCRSLF
jgi:hypothetical protein